MKNQTDTDFTKNRRAYIAKGLSAQAGWYQEYLDSGAQYRMTYTQFKKQKTRKNRSKNKAHKY